MLTAPATALMNQLSCSKKMFLISIAFITPLVFTTYFLVSEQLLSVKFAESELTGVEYIIPVRQLIQHFPEHRGMTNAYLSGNKSFKAKVLAKRQQIANDIALIDEVDQRLGEQLGTTSRWNDIKNTWQRLENEAFNGSAKQVFERHTQLIAEVLELVKQISDSSNLTLDPELGSFYIKEAIVTLLPQVVENLGQARGLSSGLAARQSVSQKESVKLTSLISTVQENVNGLKRGMLALGQVNVSLSNKIDSQVQQTIKGAESYLNFLGSKILNADSMSVQSDTVFAKGTDTIKANFQILDMLAPELKTLIQQRIDGLYSKMTIVLSIVIGLSIVAIYLFSGFLSII